MLSERSRTAAVIVAAAVLIVTMTSCTPESPRASLAPVNESQALTDSLTAPTAQLTSTDVIASWASLQQAAAGACTTSLMGESTEAAAADFADAATRFDHARTVAAESASGPEDLALATYPDRTPAVDTADWCTVAGQLTASKK